MNDRLTWREKVRALRWPAGIVAAIAVWVMLSLVQAVAVMAAICAGIVILVLIVVYEFEKDKIIRERRSR